MRPSTPAAVCRTAALLVALLASRAASAQAQNVPIGGRTATMGGAGVAAGNDSAMPYPNPAGEAGLPGDVLAVSATVYSYDTRSVPGLFHPGGTSAYLGNDLGPVTVGTDQLSSSLTGELPSSVMYFKALPPLARNVTQRLGLALVIPYAERVQLVGNYAASYSRALGRRDARGGAPDHREDAAHQPSGATPVSRATSILLRSVPLSALLLAVVCCSNGSSDAPASVCSSTSDCPPDTVCSNGSSTDFTSTGQCVAVPDSEFSGVFCCYVNQQGTPLTSDELGSSQVEGSFQGVRVNLVFGSLCTVFTASDGSEVMTITAEAIPNAPLGVQLLAAVVSWGDAQLAPEIIPLQPDPTKGGHRRARGHRRRGCERVRGEDVERRIHSPRHTSRRGFVADRIPRRAAAVAVDAPLEHVLRCPLAGGART